MPLNILRKCTTSITIISILIMVGFIVTNPSYSQIVKSFQKISATQGGYTQAGGVLEPGDDFAEQVSNIGDLDGDGVTDILIGIKKDDDGANAAGAANILFMNTNGTVKDVQKISATEGGFVGGLDDLDELGTGASGLGDVDGDGIPDIALGAWGDDDAGTNRGAVYILFLNSDGTVKSQQKISSIEGGFTGGLTSRFGGDLAPLGDLDNDGVPDLFVTVSNGGFWILYLNSDGTVKRNDRITQSGSGGFGATGALVGDVDGDGVMDLATGAQFDDDGASNAGAAWILFMNSNGTVRNRQKISLLEGGFTGLLEAGDEFGQSVSPIGDLNQDGIPDLLVGAEHADSPDGTQSNTGELWVLYLDRDGTVLDQDLINEDTENFTTIRRNANIGQAVHLLGDLDGDGVQDIIAGADGDRDPLNTGVDTGSAYVIFLKPKSPPNNAGRFQQSTDSGNLLVMEAENFSSNTSRNSHSWTNFNAGAASGGAAMQASPEIGTIYPETYITNSPRLDYDVTFTTTGTHYVWVRGFSTNGTNNSVHVGLNGNGVTSAKRIDNFVFNTWDWTNQIINGNGSLALATINVNSTGNQTLNLWMREDGFIIDKFFITTDPNFIPNGLGPAESSQGGGNTNQAPTIDNPGNQSSNQGESISLQIQADDPDGDTLIYNASGLPDGLNINNNTGLISGTASTPGTFNNITVTANDGNGEIASTTFNWEVNANSSSRFQQSAASGNLLVVEAENFSSNVQQGSDSWLLINNGGASGNMAMDSVPNNGTSVKTGYVNNSPRLDFNVTFITSGTHYVWIRGFGPNSGGDSVHVGLDGQDLTSSRRLDSFNLGTWDWSGEIQTGPGALQRATIDISASGDHTLNIWMREDGFRVDKLLLTTDPNFIPTGNGPAESPFGTGGGNQPPVIQNIGNQTVTVGSLLTIPVMATDNDGPDPLVLTTNGVPSGATFMDFGNGIGELSWMPNASAVTNSPYSVTINATEDNGNGLSATRTLSISVMPVGGVIRFQQSSASGNLLVMEAENFDTNLSQGDDSWSLLNNSGASGNMAMNSGPNNGTSIKTGYVNDSPRLDFNVNFVATGTHYVWIRGFGPNSGGDSVHVGLDGVDLPSSRRLDEFTLNTWDWSGEIKLGPGMIQRATIEVNAAGSHTMNIWMREDGFRVDKLLLTTDPNFVPGGAGPAESSRN